jgi:CubicO group peptidase (beta-lactamase class C family)/D-alanyl-D-alanine dipeptidase
MGDRGLDRRRLLALFAAASALPGIALAAPAAKQPPAAPAALDAAVRAEMEQKAIPSVALALVDGTGVIWSGGWGFADAARTVPANAETVYRAGSISKLFTDLLVMQLVEAGKLDLDKPVQTWLADFQPENPSGKAITLRHLMTHRSGLVREAPVGNYFDDHAPSPAETVRSLNRTRLVAEPGTVSKYSNAAVQVAAQVVEIVSGTPYETLVRQRLLDPAAMATSRFSVKAAGAPPAYAEMASYDGARFAAPVFDLGTPGAGGLCTTADDLGRFVQALLNGGQGQGARLMKTSTLESMWKPQDGAHGYGLGFAVDDFQGRRMLGHGGAVYGFTSDMRFLPETGVGVVVLTTLDASPSARRLAEFAISLMLAAKSGVEAPPFVTSQRVAMAEAKALSGHYSDGQSSVFLRELGGALYFEGARVAGEIRKTGTGFTIDDAQIFLDGFQIDPAAGITHGGNTYARSEWSKPSQPPADLASLIGDYGWEHNYIRVYERDGQPFVRIEWIDYEPMRQTGRDVLAFPSEGGLYPLEALHFTRDANGQGASASLNGIVFPRRDFGAEMLVRTRSMAKNSANLRENAKRATPPVETGKGPADLVALRSVDPSLRLDVRYATNNNLMGFPLYARVGAYMQRPAAQAVARADAALHAKGYSLIIHDAYRPWFVTKMFWDATPPAGHIFVADPSEGSRHNRGCAVDLSMVDLKTGELVKMPGVYDEMSSRSFPQYVGGTSLERWRRDTLRTAMEAQGFEVYAFEWWHFDFQGFERYPILNLDFDQIDAMRGRPAASPAAAS